MSTEKMTTIEPLQAPFVGTVCVPGDKSISHRAILMSAMAEGVSQVSGVLDSQDVQSSLRIIRQLGAVIELTKQRDGSLAGAITGWGKTGPLSPRKPLDCGNSGTTARLLMGMLAPWDISVEITGDESLRRRPMRRIVAPLAKMGVRFEPVGKETLPLKEQGNPNLRALTYDTPLASAQLKSAILLAGVYAPGLTIVREPFPSRNHTELMLPEYGVSTVAAKGSACVQGPTLLRAASISVPGDPSSAAFVACAALLRPGSWVTIENMSFNTGRIGFVRTLECMGADVFLHHKGAAGKEPFGALEVRYTSGLHGCEIPADKIAGLIDEIPVLALLASHVRGVTVFREVGELRVKETDRLKAVVDGLTLLGVEAWEEGNDLYIEGQPNLQIPSGVVLDSQRDHRLAMTWALVGLCGNVAVQIKDFNAAEISYPDFLSTLQSVAG